MSKARRVRPTKKTVDDPSMESTEERPNVPTVNWQVIENVGRGRPRMISPRAGVSFRSKMISINKPAMALLGVSDTDRVVLLSDEAGRRIGIRPLADGEDPGISRKFTKMDPKNNTRYISATSLINRLGVRTEEERFDTVPVLENGVLVIPLPSHYFPAEKDDTDSE